MSKTLFIKKKITTGVHPVAFSAKKQQFMLQWQNLKFVSNER